MQKQDSRLTIRTLDICRAGESAGSREIGLFEQLVGKACAAADDEGHAGLVVLEDILAVHREALLIARGNAEVFLFLAPRDGEGVVGPETNRGDVQVSVLARAEVPWACHADRNTESISWKNFNVAGSAAVSNVAHDKTNKSPGTLHTPESDNSVEHALLLAILEVDPYGAERERSTDDVTVQENLIEGVADG